MPLTLTRLLAAVLCGLTAVSFAARAQQSDTRTTTVGERERPELDAFGLRLGGFLAYSALDVVETYDDNIFAGDTTTESDFITTLRPELRLRSNWSRHRLDFFGSAALGRYSDNDKEDFNDWRVGFDGRVDYRRDTSVTGGFSFRSAHEERGSPDDVNGISPTEYQVFKPQFGFFRRWNRMTVKIDGSFESFDYDDVATPGGGAIDNDDRDRAEYMLTARAGYEFIPEFEAFAQSQYTLIDYDAGVDGNGDNRDSYGYGMSGGIRLSLSSIIFGDFFGGYIVRQYDDATLSDIEAVNYGASLTWNLTRLTTIVFSAARQINETTLANAAGAFDTSFGGTVDHELLRNLILSAKGSRRISDFTGVAREDEILDFGFSGKYMLNRFLYFTFSYDYSQRDSSVAGADFTINRAALRVRLQL